MPMLWSLWTDADLCSWQCVSGSNGGVSLLVSSKTLGRSLPNVPAGVNPSLVGLHPILFENAEARLAGMLPEDFHAAAVRRDARVEDRR